MAIKSLRRIIREMKPNATYKVPAGYEESSVRASASSEGRKNGNKYSVTKDVENRRFTVTRIS